MALDLAYSFCLCKYGEIDRQEPQSVLSTAVKQLSLLNPEGFLPKAVISLEDFEQTVIIVDALDE
ncbi:hypothetical protein RUND412_002568 [Rhizina undulata]